MSDLTLIMIAKSINYTVMFIVVVLSLFMSYKCFQLAVIPRLTMVTRVLLILDGLFFIGMPIYMLFYY